MAKVLEGLYRAKVLPFTFEKVGEKESPVANAHFQPIGQVVDNEVKAEDGLPRQQFAYWLDLAIQERGKYAGKSGVEAYKIQLEEIFGYKGSFNPEAINAFILEQDRFVNLVCEKNEKNGRAFTKTKYVNNINGKGGNRKPVKHLSADEIAAFGKEWDKGSAPAAKPADAASLFAQLTGKTDAK